MAKLKLTMALSHYDRHIPFLDGTGTVPIFTVDLIRANVLFEEADLAGARRIAIVSKESGNYLFTDIHEPGLQPGEYPR